MRKAQKQQIEEIIRQMEKVHDEIKSCIEEEISAQAQELLADCQNAAVAIGTLIEDTEGEGYPTVMVLEEYCELVYQIYESLSSDSNVNANKIYKSLRQKLIKAQNSIRNDIKIRKESVFLPYKASMWDSLESVWKAADADPDCDAYVIPIPYFNKNPDGSFKEEHYEGEQYPDYVPITKYDEFDFGKHMPDVIYIHNGYDDWNLVTSVHPDFYSRNLKKYTEKLIYIPYFVLGEIDPDNEQAAEGMKHFCFMPGIINADKVIVQSENMKKIYVREYLKEAKKCGLTGHHLDRTYLEKKFLGIGSPKFDKLANTMRKDVEIPREWQRIINRPDGTAKKIIFYNNSIGALLAQNEKMIAKIESVFRIFKENREEIALLWRPHPLIESTLTAMRPQLWEAYKVIRDQYLAEGWGIYDDTPDLDRAIVISDAYYGDGSSVVHLYQKTGKPIMIQNPDVMDFFPENEISKNEWVVHFENLYDDGECFWFTADNCNALFKMDKDTWETEYIGKFPDENDLGFRLYAEIIEYEGRLFFTPLYAREIGVYDKRNRTFSKISFDELGIGFLEDSGQAASFYSAHLIGDCIYFMPHERNAALKYDITNNAVYAIYDWADAVTEKYELTMPRLIFKSVYINGCIYAPISGGNLLEVIDISSGRVSVLEIGAKGTTYFDICFLKDSAIIVPLQGTHIIRLRLPDMEITEIPLEESNIYQFFSIETCGDKLYAIPYQYKEMLEITIDDKGKVLCTPNKTLNEMEKTSYRHPTDSRYLSEVTSSNRLYIYDSFEKKLICYTPLTGELRKESIRAKMCAPSGIALKEMLTGVYRDMWEKSSNIIVETRWQALDILLKCE